MDSAAEEREDKPNSMADMDSIIEPLPKEVSKGKTSSLDFGSPNGEEESDDWDESLDSTTDENITEADINDELPPVAKKQITLDEDDLNSVSFENDLKDSNEITPQSDLKEINHVNGMVGSAANNHNATIFPSGSEESMLVNGMMGLATNSHDDTISGHSTGMQQIVDMVDGFCAKITPYIEHLISKWHEGIIVIIGKCIKGNKCHPLAKPTTDKSCEVCCHWVDLIESVVIRSSLMMKSTLKWNNIFSCNLSVNPVVVAKLFAIHAPYERLCNIKRIGNLDARSILTVLGGMSFLLDNRKDGGTNVSQFHDNMKKLKADGYDFDKLVGTNGTKEKENLVKAIQRVLDALNPVHHIGASNRSQVGKEHLDECCFAVVDLAQKCHDIDHITLTEKEQIIKDVYKVRYNQEDKDVQISTPKDSTTIGTQFPAENDQCQMSSYGAPYAKFRMGLVSTAKASKFAEDKLEFVKFHLTTSGYFTKFNIQEKDIAHIRNMSELLSFLEKKMLFSPNNLLFLSLLLEMVKEDTKEGTEEDGLAKEGTVEAELLAKINKFAKSYNKLRPPLTLKKLKRNPDDDNFYVELHIDGHIDEANGHLIEDYRSRLATWLGLDPPSLVKFIALGEGCIILLFELPNGVKKNLHMMIYNNASKMVEASITSVTVDPGFDQQKTIKLNEEMSFTSVTSLSDDEGIVADKSIKRNREIFQDGNSTGVQQIVKMVDDFCMKITPHIEHVTSKWHEGIVKKIGKCKTEMTCQIFVKPNKKESCEVCRHWVDQIESVVFESNLIKRGALKWDSIHSSTLSENPIQVVKLFVVSAPCKSLYNIQRFNELDDRAILNVLGGMSFLLDTRNDFATYNSQFRKKDEEQKKDGHDCESTNQKKEDLVKAIQQVSDALDPAHHQGLINKSQVDEKDLDESCLAVMDLTLGFEDLGYISFEETEEIIYDKSERLFKDPIHGNINLPNYCVAVIYTPEFQRLRRIKQLGAAESVYPSATHNRFAHSIGVCYLAGKVIKHLKDNQPELQITDHEVKCVRLAGLCHDLGHGPFSHLFESVVNRSLPAGRTWKHEDSSVQILRHLNTENNIGLEEDELNLISDLISGNPLKDDRKKCNYYKNRRFLYQIVANRDNGVDVDKWDYFARDCHYLGVPNSFDHSRIIPFMRVCKCTRDVQDETAGKKTGEFLEICYRDKLMRDLSSMFAVRWDLHVKAYQHRVVMLTEEMYADVLHEYFTEDAKKQSPEFGPMEKVVHDMHKYSQLDDHIVGSIRRSTNPELKKARSILRRIEKRDLYQCIGEILDADSKNVPKDVVIKILLANDCTEEDLVIINDYGMKSKYPLKHIYFYTKEDNTKGITLDDEKMSPTLPTKTQMRDIRLYTRARVPPEDLPRIRQVVKKNILKRAECTPPSPYGKPSNKATDVPLYKIKVFEDPIHGSISLPNYCVAVIDTPEFQRLRNIKQLGAAESVYPGATHNRFAHSIGVCYLAGKVIKHLKENQPELQITDHEVKCVQLAGLCHDLGHGPFSHKFESVVNRLSPTRCTWKHEEASVEMLHHLNTENNIGLEEDELNLTSDLISGNPLKDKRENHYKNRRFLYQIVANKDNGVDVDKWDFFARDCHYLGLANSFDHSRIIPFMRVCKCTRDVQDETAGKKTGEFLEICYRDKLMRDLSSMFTVRWDLHVRAYQHRVIKLTNEMCGDALYQYFREDAKKQSPEFGPMENVVHDMHKYSQLDDHIVGSIRRSTNPELKKARSILRRIEKRDLYQCIGEILDADSKEVPKDDVIQTLLTNDRSLKPYCTEENLVIINHKCDYGMKSKNPLKHIYFYTRKDNTKGIILGDEEILPTKIQMRDVRLYTRARVPPEDLPEVKKAVENKILNQANVTPHVTSTDEVDDRVSSCPMKLENPSSKAIGEPYNVRRSGDKIFDE